MLVPITTINKSFRRSRNPFSKGFPVFGGKENEKNPDYIVFGPGE